MNDKDRTLKALEDMKESMAYAVRRRATADVVSLEAQVESLSAQVAELKKDAERMEYLDKNMRVLRADADGVRHYIDVPLADSLRLAIDAAKESGDG